MNRSTERQVTVEADHGWQCFPFLLYRALKVRKINGKPLHVSTGYNFFYHHQSMQN